MAPCFAPRFGIIEGIELGLSWRATMKQVVLVGALDDRASPRVQPGAAGRRWPYSSQDAAGHRSRSDHPAGEVALGFDQPGEGREGRRQAAGGRHVSGATDRSRRRRAAPGQTEGLGTVGRVRAGRQSGRARGRHDRAAGRIGQVQKDTPPAANGAKVEMLKGGDYVRVWINKGGNHYLLHLPV